MKCVTNIYILLQLIQDMAENNCPDKTETKDVIDFGEYSTKDDNKENEIRKLNLK